MKFFVSRIRYKDGDLMHPVTAFAGNISEAFSAICAAVNDVEIGNIYVSERPVADAEFLGIQIDDPVVRVHPSIIWTREESASSPTWPLDTSSSGDAEALIPDIQSYLMDAGPDVRPGETGQQTHERRQGEDLKSMPNGGRGSGQTWGGGG
nr:hypothetical protein [uncultured Shinella sp.]